LNTEEIAELFTDRISLIESLITIENKARDTVPLILNPIQRDVILTETGRDVFVKPAQVGFSTIKIIDYLIDCLTIKGTVAVIISHEAFITQRLLRKAQAAYDALRERIPAIPEMYHKSSFEKTFPGMNSSFYIGSAQSYVFGRGETIHDLLIDEYAFWEQDAARRILTPAIQRVPLEGRIAIGSTANGEGNDFFEVYKEAKEGKKLGRSIFTPHFYPWFAHPEYTMPYDSPFALPADRTPKLDLIAEERDLVRLHNLTHDQIRWRRYKIVEMNSLRRSGELGLLFNQEYPEDDVSCFLAAGDMAYDPMQVNKLAEGCYPAPDSYMGMKVWHKPEEDARYLIAVDPGLGKVSETVASVWHFTDEKFTHCATWGGLYAPEATAMKLKEIGRYYNNAKIAPEANSHGLAVIALLKDYPNKYLRRDFISGRVGKEIGWLTTPRTKPYMITEVARNLDKVDLHDIDIVSQMRNIRQDGDRFVSVGADDYHDSFAIAMVTREGIQGTYGYMGSYQTWED